MKSIGTDIHWLALGLINVYLIKNKHGFTLIDTGAPGSFAAIEKALGALGGSLRDIKTILITHGHYDHIGDLTELKEASGAQVYAHTLEAPIIRGDIAPPLPAVETLGTFGKLLRKLPLPKQIPAPVDRELVEGETLDELREGLRVVHLPGHSPGQVGYYLPNERLLFGGDVMMNLLSILTLPIVPLTPDLNEAKRSLHKVDTLKLRTLALGHGRPLLENTTERISRLSHKHHTRQAQGA